MTPSATITDLLSDLYQGDPNASGKLMPLIYSELRKMASRLFDQERAAQSMQPTDLVHETFLNLIKPGYGPWRDRQHFFAIASLNMRQRLVDHARKRRAERRGGNWKRVSFEDLNGQDLAFSPPEAWSEILTVHELLNRLAAQDPRQARIVELRYFTGLTVDETAEVLNLSHTTVTLEWRIAKAWMRKELSKGGDVPTPDAA